MKIIPGVLMVCMLMSFIYAHKPGNKKITVKTSVTKSQATDTTEQPIIQYSDLQLEAFLDSVGHLHAKPLADKVAFGADSIFRNQKQLNTMISEKDFQILKTAAHKGMMTVKAARRIFKNNDISYSCNEKDLLLTNKKGLISVVYYPFDKNKDKFDEYALCIGCPGHCVNAFIYFFKGKRIIARHEGYSRYGPELNHYRDADGKAVVYYVKEFDDGSGIWWNNFFFYKYYGSKLIPVLNEVQNANLLQPSPWGVRELWLESFIQKTNPLILKMVYHQDLADTLYRDSDQTDSTSGVKIVDDSTVVRYRWNEQTKSFLGQYQESKISKGQILSYYLVDNELLFINAHYKILKELLLDKTKRKSTLYYINKIKSHHSKQ